jgi:hypothetical protein
LLERCRRKRRERSGVHPLPFRPLPLAGPRVDTHRNGDPKQGRRKISEDIRWYAANLPISGLTRSWRLNDLWRLGSIRNRRNKLHGRVGCPIVWFGSDWSGALRVQHGRRCWRVRSCRLLSVSGRMAMRSRGAVETNGRAGGESAGRGDHIAGYFAAPGRVCSGLRTTTGSMGRFSCFVPISYPFSYHV